jgi:hypothetical protein
MKTAEFYKLWYLSVFLLSFGATSLSVPGYIIPRISRSHTTTHQSVGLLWTSDQLVAETSTWQNTILTTDISMSTAGFETTISAGERT